jgi:hypothetical protein
VWIEHAQTSSAYLWTLEECVDIASTAVKGKHNTNGSMQRRLQRHARIYGYTTSGYILHHHLHLCHAQGAQVSEREAR